MIKIQTIDKNYTTKEASLKLDSTREAFYEWLSAGKVKKYAPIVCVTCLDAISEYAISKKICTCSIWEITQKSIFEPVYQKLLNTKLLRVTDRNTYKVFTVAGQLYLKFLREKPWTRIAAGVPVSKYADSTIGSKPLLFCNEDPTSTLTLVTGKSEDVASAEHAHINPEKVISWLITQPNANGTLYLENVVRQYMSVLHSAPTKLHIADKLTDRNVFSCHTPEELNLYWDIFKNAPNYKQVNRNTSGMFSAGMGCLLRYLKSLSPTKQAKGSEIWNSEIRCAFQVWLTDDANYSPKTAKIYAGAVSRVISRYSQIAVMAVNNTTSQVQSVQRFIALLSEDSDFVATNAKRHNQLTAALSAFERFAASREAANKEPRTADIDSHFILKLTDILSAHFSNGYRLNSPIELARFRAFATQELGEEFSLTDNEIKGYIENCGIIYDGKVYMVPTQAKEKISVYADEYFATGAQVIFFSEFYAKNETWLFSASIVSEDMLTVIIRQLFPDLLFTSTYFGHINVPASVALENEILRVWGNNIFQTYHQLEAKLRYIPLDRIKYALSQNGDFIWNSVETFSHVGQIEITDEEKQAIYEAVAQECNTRGYAPFTDLPFGEIEERNYELSITALQNAVYRICLSDKFDKKGKIITRKGDVFDARIIMKEHCQTIDKCSLDDLLNYEKELTGEIHRWIPMEVGNTFLVRIDKQTYVADKYAHFNVDLIDDAIESIIRGKYLPLKAFITFGSFPDCGFPWNLFLLESYCRRFSQKFRFDTSSVNSRNIGAVIHKSCEMDYIEIMTDAVANTDIPLKNADVGRFLFDSGYTGRCTTTKAVEIIAKAKTIRERRN